MRVAFPARSNWSEFEDRRGAVLILVDRKVHRTRSFRERAAAAVYAHSGRTRVGYSDWHRSGSGEIRGRNRRGQLVPTHLGCGLGCPVKVYNRRGREVGSVDGQNQCRSAVACAVRRELAYRRHGARLRRRRGLGAIAARQGKTAQHGEQCY